jgi:hypothetical protein
MVVVTVAFNKQYCGAAARRKRARLSSPRLRYWIADSPSFTATNCVICTNKSVESMLHDGATPMRILLHKHTALDVGCVPRALHLATKCDGVRLSGTAW